MELNFREKIPKSNNNTIVTVPNLSHQNLVLTKIDFESEQWYFEVSVKCAGTDLAKMTTTYFKHSTSFDLSGFRSKLEEGDKVELFIKPKQAPKDLELMISYTYSPTQGAFYYQSSERLMDLKESTVLTDITQNMRPTQLYLKADAELQEVALVPRFMSTQDPVEFRQSLMSDDEKSVCHLDFSSDPVLIKILPLLRYYELQVKVDTSNVDAQIHFLAQGFKVSQ